MYYSNYNYILSNQRYLTYKVINKLQSNKLEEKTILELILQ